MVRAFTLTNAHGLELRAIEYGGIIVSLRTPDRAGALADIVLGFHRLAEPEGIVPALEPAHALARALDLDAELVLVGLSGRGDKALAEVLGH